MALRWAKAGVEVIIGSRQHEKAARVAAELNQEFGQELIKGMANPEAAAAGEVVALTVPFSAPRSTIENIKNSMPRNLFNKQ
jgi:predicted dinucleotide-binding enzyme